MLILSGENIFLIVLAVVWLVGAILQDLHRREVDNIWNFSLIGFALAYRLAVSGFTGNYWFFLNGLIGFGIFLFLGNLFYYSRLFAGGDAKLVIALGAILPLSYSWLVNVKIFGVFIGGFLVGGSLYVFAWSLALVFVNFNSFVKEYGKQVKMYKHYFNLSLLFALIFGGLLYFMEIDVPVCICFSIRFVFALL